MDLYQLLGDVFLSLIFVGIEVAHDVFLWTDHLETTGEVRLRLRNKKPGLLSFDANNYHPAVGVVWSKRLTFGGHIHKGGQLFVDLVDPLDDLCLLLVLRLAVINDFRNRHNVLEEG